MRYLRICLVAMCLTACASAKNDANERPRPAKEIVSGAARLRGGGLRMDVQVGRGLTTRPLAGGAITATPNAVVTP